MVARGGEDSLVYVDCSLNISTNQSGKNPPSGCFACDKEEFSPVSTFHYYCTTCDVEFHQFCHGYPRKLTHPYHLQHPLTLTTQNTETNIISSYIFKICNWCGDDLREGSKFYRCSICKFCLDLSCSYNIPPLTITNPKSHHHPLFLFPWPLSIPCQACGLVSLLEPSYACFPIWTSRNESLGKKAKLDGNNGADQEEWKISLNKQKFNEIGNMHQATKMEAGNVWDRRELEWEPEEPDETEDNASFKKVGDGMIKYFSHEHHLKLEKYDSVRDAKKQCQACILRIDSNDQFYNCMQCDFILHEVCAGLSRKLAHALHRHPLVLDPSPILDYNSAGCSTCARESTGFRYKCSENDCDDEIQIDVRCILVPDCFTHKSHEHPLFISTSLSRKGMISCGGSCKDSVRDEYYLQCTECTFAMCYRCATIPHELYYKYDAHPLSLCYGESTEKAYWCEVCEKQILRYIKSDYTFYFGSDPMKILGNNSHTRPICYKCNNRCPHYVYYKLFERDFCSWDCVWTSDIANCNNSEEE
ncbi:hypothetical protein EUTSA_v10023009mg [Eutrema salsugineum]|uniref:Phorbol-ester/DAG-type domain-containing protein n=1 Tax=Eutrema salsugineum TaxID=72664 RepID=V4M3F2_EUTSA|nr:hypothetical protein EUTSA_v10023009mg [Eutrema salsugineum]